MVEDEINDSLRGLHEELDGSVGADDEQQQRIDDLKDQVGMAIESDGPESENAYQRLRHRLHDDVTQFEATHPDLTEALARVIDSLTAYGI